MLELSSYSLLSFVVAAGLSVLAGTTIDFSIIFATPSRLDYHSTFETRLDSFISPNSNLNAALCPLEPTLTLRASKRSRGLHARSTLDYRLHLGRKC